MEVSPRPRPGQGPGIGSRHRVSAGRQRQRVGGLAGRSTREPAPTGKSSPAQGNPRDARPNAEQNARQNVQRKKCKPKPTQNQCERPKTLCSIFCRIQHWRYVAALSGDILSNGGFVKEFVGPKKRFCQTEIWSKLSVDPKTGFCRTEMLSNILVDPSSTCRRTEISRKSVAGPEIHGGETART